MRRRSVCAARAAGVAAFTAILVCSAFVPARALAIVVDFAALPAGHVLQSSDFPAGTMLSVINNNPTHPQSAIIFNSACTVGTCSGDDDDLRTPGVGPGNTIPHGKVMIIAENVRDTSPADGIVDNPDDERRGGTVTLQFSMPYKLHSVAGIDFEPSESPTRVEIDKVGGGTVVFPFLLLGDNSAEILTIPNPPPALAIRFIVTGTGAFDELNLVPACGDNIVDPGEQCDPPGSPAGGGTCSASCTISGPACGNATIDAGEECDPPSSQGGDDACNDDCTLSECGDGTVGAGEECDPPASEGGADACNDDCTLAVCGDGNVEAGEECDPPGPVAGGTCLPNCTLLVGDCGDATIDVGEECDPPASLGGNPLCNDDCTLSVCGDDDIGAGEECDPSGSLGGAPNCNLDCTLSVCGDGVTEAGEECDPPNGTSCDASCQNVEVCGNGVIDQGEQCDPPKTGEICNNGIDDDNDGLMDCKDLTCAMELVIFVTCGALCERVECEPLISDPGKIIVNEPGGVGFFSVHGRVRMEPEAFDPRAASFAVDLRNDYGQIYRGALFAGDLQEVGKRRYRFLDRGAREQNGVRDGLFRVGTRFRKIGGEWFYTFQIRAYGDFSRATLPHMTTQIYSGPSVGYLSADWRPTKKGWRLNLRDFNAQ